MKACVRQNEVVRAVRAGWYPTGCTEELREHLAACAPCAETARMTSAFTAAREGAMRMASPQAAGLLWWKAQLRRRHEAMEKLKRPGLVIPAWTLAASIVLLMAVLIAACKRTDRMWWETMLASARWNVWLAASVVAVLCGFAIVAVMAGLGLTEERE